MRFKQIAPIQQLMNQKEQIRNIGIIAHIDHGKTTLADSLLAGAGLLSTQMAGVARVLDYLEEEQKRKITIKTANMSLLIQSEGKDYIINLVDTPGHVDFTGKVTRALRVIDGAVVVVDAVEEIMAQTEIVTRQALEERVQPVLFINKIDRLITELHLSPEQIEQKLDHIISSFNDLIELYAEQQFKKHWKIEPAKGNVAFGSALHGWGFTMNIAKQKQIKFQKIVDVYLKGEQDVLRKIFSVQGAIFEMATKTLPNPKAAQEYRIEKIWDGLVNSAVGNALVECSDDGPAVICITNIAAQTEGCIASGRVFSGTVKKGDKLHLVNALAEADVGEVFLDMGSFREQIGQAQAGGLASFSLPVMVKAGETLIDYKNKAGMVPFESIHYVSEPVVTLAVEPKNPKDIPQFLLAMEKLAVEDPNLRVSVDKDTGEYKLSGMGELHLEVAVNQLKKEHGLVFEASSPRVVCMESVSKKGVVAKSSSPNKQNVFSVVVEPETEELEGKVGGEGDGNILSFDENRNVLVDCGGKTEGISEEELEAVIAGFQFACKAGPLCGEPMRHIKVNLVDLTLSEKEECKSPEEIMRGVGKAVFASFLSANPVLIEPIYQAIISLPTELSGETQRIMTTRRGKISSFEQKGLLTEIKGFIPVAETFGFSKQMRSATSGRVFWQFIFDHWECVPEKNAEKIIEKIRVRKGLAKEVPKPERFMD
jgi:elongation factor 2